MAGRQNTGICNKLDVAGYLGIIILHSDWPKLWSYGQTECNRIWSLVLHRVWTNVLSLGQSLYGRKTEYRYLQ